MIVRRFPFYSIAPSKIDEMAIYLKTLEVQGFFRIFGAKNISGFYGCEIPTSETRTSDLLLKIRANIC